jgi:hypothetical protein
MIFLRPAARPSVRLLLPALVLAAAAGCSSPGARDRAVMDRDALLVNVVQEVFAYYEAANRNDAERVRQLKEQIQPKVDGNLAVFTEFLLNGKNDDEKMMAAAVLGLSSNRKVVLVLLETLGSPSDGIRHHACLSLGTFGYTGTPAEPLVRLLVDPSARVRRDAAWVLSRILQRGQGMLYITEEDIQDWQGLCFRIALEAEGETPAPGRRINEILPRDVRDVIQECRLRNSFEDTHRADLLRGLNIALKQRDLYREKDFAPVELPPSTKTLLRRERSELTDREIETLNRSLLESAYPAFISPAQGRERGWAFAALVRTLDDEDPLVRCEAVIALGTIGSPEAVDPIVRKSLIDTDARVRGNAACALGLIRDRRAVEPLIQSMRENQRDPDIVNAIKFGLREITGQDYGGSYTGWKSWWEEQKQPLPRMPGQESKPDAGTEKKTEAAPGASPAAPAKKAAVPPAAAPAVPPVPPPAPVPPAPK